MNWDRIEGNWKEFKGKVQQKWGKLTDDDMNVIEGKRSELTGRLQQRYGRVVIDRVGVHGLNEREPIGGLRRVGHQLADPRARFAVPREIIEFDDQFAGPQRFDVARQLGDFVIAKADGTAAYQLAVVVDDAAMNITQVVRGNDLLDSTPRQILLYRALGLEDRIPKYTHLPLVVGADGLRLAKRHGVKIVINTDSHHTSHMEKIRYGVLQARRAWLTKDDVLNTLPAQKFAKAMKHAWT